MDRDPASILDVVLPCRRLTRSSKIGRVMTSAAMSCSTSLFSMRLP